LIAVVIALYFLYDANKISKEAFEENRRANLEALARVDSTISMQREALQLQKVQVATEQKDNVLREKEIFEKNKPVVSILLKDVAVTDSSLEIFVVVDNEGLSNMEDVFIYLGTKRMVTSNPMYAEQFWDFPTFLTQKGKVLSFAIKGWQNSDFLCFIDVRYRWKIMNYDGSEKKSFICSYIKQSNKYRIAALDKYEHKKYWGYEY